MLQCNKRKRQAFQDRFEKLPEISSSEEIVCVCFGDGTKSDDIIDSNMAGRNDTVIYPGRGEN